jgi:hypothetical protein
VQGLDPCSEQRLRVPAKIIGIGCLLTSLLVRRLVRLLGLGPAPDQKDLEIAVLRHQLAVRHPGFLRGLHTLEAKTEPCTRLASARSLRDTLMVPVLLVTFQANYSVLGTRKRHTLALGVSQASTAHRSATFV